MQFEDLKLKRQFLNALHDLGYVQPTQVQMQTIPRILAGQDLIGVAQTGTGKTAAFVLPLLQKLKGRQDGKPRVVVLVPTKELALQVTEAVRSFAAYTDIRALTLVGGVGPKTQIAELEAGTDVVVATPGRFMELYLRGSLVTKHIHSLVLDEADRMMDMGFMPQLRDILEVVPRKRQNLLFSATFPARVEKLADEFLLWPTRVDVTPEGTPVESVEQFVVRAPNVQTKINAVKHWLIDTHPDSRALLFVRTKEDAKRVHRALADIMADQVSEIHSNKAQHTRLAAMSKFRQGDIRVLVSTDVSARGIDVPETEVVINFNVPRMSDDYVHRIGRTGRADRSGTAYTLVDPTEEVGLKRILDRLPATGRPLDLDLPSGIHVEETPPWEAKAMARTIDFQRRKADPTYKGAFHEKKKKTKGKTRSGGKKRR
jgi:ATP-dependent RNA helicase RhlE